ncbi:MAG: rhodanese-like domain-containing protein [Nitrospirota bacterium]
MRAKRTRYGLLALALLAAPAIATTADAPRITREEAKALLDAPKVVFVDARTESAWSKSGLKIKGAVRIDKWDIEMWASSYPGDTTFIVY